jgi:hypothetical protein
MPKKVYEAVLPEGRKVTRSTDRTYTHVIIAKHADWYWDSFRKNYNEKHGRTEGNLYFVASWAGTPELAQKALRAAQTMHMHSRDADNGKLMHKDVRMIPCYLKK